MEASALWPGKVVTERAPLCDFWEAEPEHQDYLERIPNGYLPLRQAGVETAASRRRSLSAR